MRLCVGERQRAESSKDPSEMAWNGRFGDDDEGSGLELSLGLPGYFSASPTQAAGAAASFSFMCFFA